MKTVTEWIEYLKQKDSFILAIDGMCGSGKSTLAKYIKEELDCIVFHMDDFYLPIEKRTKERLDEPGGNVDYERFEETVLKPLSLKQDISYQPFLCSKMQLSSTILHMSYYPKIIIEGSYSLRPELVPYYTDIVVLKISSDLQIERLRQRNPKNIKQFQEKWIPLENKYFDYYDIFNQYPTLLLKD